MTKRKFNCSYFIRLTDRKLKMNQTVSYKRPFNPRRTDQNYCRKTNERGTNETSLKFSGRATSNRTNRAQQREKTKKRKKKDENSICSHDEEKPETRFVRTIDQNPRRLLASRPTSFPSKRFDELTPT